MSEPQKSFCWVKEPRHNLWFHLYKFQKQIQILYGDRNLIGVKDEGQRSMGILSAVKELIYFLLQVWIPQLYILSNLSNYILKICAFRVREILSQIFKKNYFNNFDLEKKQRNKKIPLNSLSSAFVSYSF